MARRISRSIFVALVAVSASSVPADEGVDSLDTRLKSAGVKFTAHRDALRRVESIKAIQAEVERYKAARNAANDAARLVQTEIDSYGNPRFLNSVQLAQRDELFAGLHAFQYNAAAAGRSIDALNLRLPAGLAWQDVFANVERTRREYLNVFPGIIGAADAERDAGNADREAIVRRVLGHQIPVGEPLEAFIADLKKYMAENEVAARKPMPGPAPAPAPAPRVEVAGPVPFADGKYYRLSSGLQPDRSIDVKNDGQNNKPVLVKSAGFSGQRWKFQAEGDGFYRITNAWQRDKSLDIASDGSGGIFLNLTGAGTGQLWKVVRQGDGSYRITNKKRQQHSLSITNGGTNETLPMLAESAEVKGQSWKIGE